jgi:hypothetical protein
MCFKKSIFLLFSFLFCFSIYSNAQFSWGLEAGYTSNHLVTDNSNQSFTNYTSRSGFTVAIPALYKLNDWLSLKTKLTYIQKNYSIVRTGYYAGIYQNNNNSYLQIPLMLQCNFGDDNFQGFVNLGVYGGYWLAGKQKGVEANILNPVDSAAYSSTAPSTYLNETNGYSYNESYAFDSRKDKRFEFGYVAGLGLNYELKKGKKLFAEANYYYSVTDQQKKYQTNLVPRYNSTVAITVGILFSIGNTGEFYYYGKKQ